MHKKSKYIKYILIISLLVVGLLGVAAFLFRTDEKVDKIDASTTVQVGSQSAPYAMNASTTVQVESQTAPCAISVSTDVSGGTAPYTVTYDFDTSNGIKVDKAHPKASWVYAEAGDYTITTTVTDALGEVAQTVETVKVLPDTQSEASDPIVLRDVNGTKEDPIVIENLIFDGKLFKDNSGNAITLENASHVVIRNCTFIGIGLNADIQNSDQGCAISALGVEHLTIERCVFEDNLRAIKIWQEPRKPRGEGITLKNNVVLRTQIDCALSVDHMKQIEVTGNILMDNGNPDYFEKHRITAIRISDFESAEVSENYTSGSSSDGIGFDIGRETYERDASIVAGPIQVHHNTSIGNGEQGIWICKIHGGAVYENYIDDNRLRGCSGIMLEWDVKDLEIHDNVIKNSSVSGISVNLSRDNNIYNNYLSEPNAGRGCIWVSEVKQQDWWGTLVPKSTNNQIHHNMLTNSCIGVYMDSGTSNEIYNNTLTKLGPFENLSVAGIYMSDKAFNTQLWNNIFYYNYNPGIVDHGSQTVITNNAFWKNDNETIPKQSKASIVKDPQFVNPQKGDYTLKATSPCINGGKNGSLMGAQGSWRVW